MKHRFSRRERNVIIAGGTFLIFFLVLWFVLQPTWGERSRLKQEVRRMTGEYEEIVRIERQYKLLKRETDPVMQKILQRRKDFDLSAFVAEKEDQLKFERLREFPPGRSTYGNFEKRTSRFRYESKALHQIAEYLTEMEKPENVISIETLRITPNQSDRSQLSLDISLVTVVPVK